MTEPVQVADGVVAFKSIDVENFAKPPVYEDNCGGVSSGGMIDVGAVVELDKELALIEIEADTIVEVQSRSYGSQSSEIIGGGTTGGVVIMLIEVIVVVVPNVNAAAGLLLDEASVEDDVELLESVVVDAVVISD